MKYSSITFILLLVFVFYSCGQKKENDAQNNGDTKTETQSGPKFEGKVLFQSYNGCKENSDSCSYIKITYDEMTAGKSMSAINSQINTILLTTMYPLGDSTYGSLDAMMNGFINDYETTKKEIPDMPGSWYLNATMKDTTGTEKILSFRQNFDMFTGGAHPSYFEYYYNFNAETGDSITLNDIFKPGYEKQLTDLVVAKFRKDQNLPADKPLTDAGLFADSLTFNNNFLLTKEGITFHYNIYEIWAYVYGPAEVFIPYADLKAILKENGIY